MTKSVTRPPQHLVTDFDIYDPANAGAVDRYNELIGDLAARGPVVYSTAHGGHWIVTGYEEAHSVLRDTATFSSYPNNLYDAGDGKFIPVELDPPEHTAYRQVLLPLFSPTRMRALEPEIRTTVNRLIDGFAARGSAEFISEFAHQLPATVFLKLMGWPVEDAELFSEATHVNMFGKPGLTEEENVAVRQEAAQQMFGYFANVVADRRARNDHDDITTRIINTPLPTADGTRALTDEELCRMFLLLLIAGLHTVQGSLAWSVMHLSGRSDERQRLIDDPNLLPQAVEEMLRIEAAVSAGRRVMRDVEVGGVHMKAGDQLIVSLGAVNRDTREFDQPGAVRIDRSPNRHLAFGAGPHRCIGSHLARIEMSVTLEELHRRIPDYRVETTKPTISQATQIRGVLQLPIVFTPEAV
ncbi:cytochrome P450 [Mycolicibacterium chitae]|uniref:Steroid C26-monooxygenase n=1 Tax=Mycolicibacterium chitae TaxID=1792 RepID=A0A448IA38_MYCCI|nr:cytochrome P450 [Mycolicibacterium chitae]MCV7105043.1 cytochrome P450 [Mycolicibacterium chitae]BBZ05677.1 cytochrome P450 [Mycolicibacterium chitae]VEG49288.1 cytochrome P450 [Mycolicibacterium chitae]